MKTGGRQTDEDIAVSHQRTIEDPAALDDADDKAGNVVLAVAIESRHLGRFAAEKRHAVLRARRRHPTDDVRHHVGLEAPGS